MNIPNRFVVHGRVPRAWHGSAGAEGTGQALARSSPRLTRCMSKVSSQIWEFGAQADASSGALGRARNRQAPGGRALSFTCVLSPVSARGAALMLGDVGTQDAGALREMAVIHA